MFDKHPDIEAVVMAWRTTGISSVQEVQTRHPCPQHEDSHLDLEEYDKITDLVDKAGIVCQ